LRRDQSRLNRSRHQIDTGTGINIAEHLNQSFSVWDSHSNGLVDRDSGVSKVKTQKYKR